MAGRRKKLSLSDGLIDLVDPNPLPDEILEQKECQEIIFSLLDELSQCRTNKQRHELLTRLSSFSAEEIETALERRRQ